MKTEGKRLFRLFAICYLVTVACGAAFLVSPTVAIGTCIPLLVIAVLLVDRRARNKVKASLGGQP